jgi:catechol 2,3-dioxygenase
MGHTPKYLGHVNIYVRNAEKAQQCYQDILGLHTYDFVPGRAAFMAANKEESHEVALMEVGEDAPGAQPGQVGLNHMAWRVESLEDLKEFYHHLKGKGVPMKVADHGISLGLYFQDPDGNGIEVYYEQPRSQWYRQEKLFLHGDRPKGNFPGPWDEVLAGAS